MSLKRATFTLTALCTVFALVASACGSDEEEAAPAATTAAPAAPAAVEYTTPSGDSFTLSADTATKLASGEKVKILTIVNGTAIPIFGEQVRLGADRACDAGTSKYAAECQFAGPPQGDVVELVNQLEAILAAGGIDCLALQTFPPGALVDIVDREVDGGMPVFTYNVDIPDSKRFAQYALNELAAGTLVGQTTANIVVANGLDVKKIALGTGDPAGQWAQDRMEGFRAGFTEVLPDTEWHNDHLSGIQTAVNWTVQETVDTVGPFMAANPDVDLFFHTDQGVEGVGIAIRDQGRTGEVFTSGFNTSAQILELIDGGEILVTADQGFDNQAELATTACFDLLFEGEMPADEYPAMDPVIIANAPGARSTDEIRDVMGFGDVIDETALAGDVCQGQDGSGLKVAYGDLATGIPFVTQVWENIQEVAAACNLEIVYADNNLDGETALENARTFTLQGVDGVIQFQIDQTIEGALCDELRANDPDLPVIAIDIAHPSCALFFGANNPRAGELAGEGVGQWAKENWDCGIDMIITLETFEVGDVNVMRSNGSVRGIQNVCSDLAYGDFEEWAPEQSGSIVTRINGGGTTDSAFPLVLDTFTANPGKRIAVVSLNDDMGLAALAAAEELGIEDNVVYGSQGADATIHDTIRTNSHYVGSTAYFPEAYGTYVVPLILKMINGVSVEDPTLLDHLLITADNIDDYYPADGADEAWVNDIRPATQRWKIGYGDGYAGIPFTDSVTDSINEIAAEMGVDILYCDNAVDQEKTLQCANLIVAQEADGVIFANWIGGTEDLIAGTFTDAGLPCVSYDGPHPGCVAFGPDNFASAREAGLYLGRYANEQGWDPAATELIVLWVPDVPVMPARRDGSIAGVKEVFDIPDDNVHVDLPHKANDDVFPNVTDWITAHPNAENVLCFGHSDQPGVDCALALEQGGFLGRAAAASLGASDEALVDLRGRTDEESIFKATISFFPERYGEYLVPAVVDMLEGKSVPDAIVPSVSPVTRANVHDLYPADDGDQASDGEYTTPSGDSFTLSADTATKLASGEKVKILTIVNGTAIPIFGEQVRLGADRACDAGTSKYAAECQFAGPPQGDVVELVNQLEAILAAGGIDCLALQTFPPGALVDIVDREVDGGMPVFTYNVDIPDSKRFAQYALNELAAGTLVGQTTANIVVANGLDVKKIALGTGDPAGQWAQDRMEGFRAGFTEVLPDTEWHNDHLSGIQTAVNWTVQETVDTVGPFLAANPDVDLFFHTDQGVEGVGIAIRDQGRTGEVFTSGFNTSAQILELIDGGEILVTADQGFDNQAELATTACFDLLFEGEMPADEYPAMDPVIIANAPGARSTDEIRDVMGFGDVIDETALADDVCQGQDGSGLKVAYGDLATGIPFVTQVWENIQEVAAACNLEIVYADNNLDGETALENARTFTLQGVDGVIQFQIDQTIEGALCDELRANDPDLPVIAIDIAHPSCALFFGANNPRAGELAGEGVGQWAKENWDCGIDMIITLETFEVGDVNVMRSNGSVRGIQNVCSDLAYGDFEEWAPEQSGSIVTRINGGGTTDSAFPLVLDTFTANPGKRIAVVSLNDDMGLAALAAAEELGIEDNVVYGSQGADATIHDTIRTNSHYVGSTAYFPEAYGTYVVPLILKMINGVSVEDPTLLDHLLITADNIDDYYPAG
uniref:ABC-type sugar transport system, periplasmic component n=1 Tax=uncultured actinobacterium HF0500_35G12 TaxID=723604 RepID=E7C658_9ACTN|nr:ABC-type sugar transport system, periplasmic component [uncultured actinobacterium HF0500_35G12]